MAKEIDDPGWNLEVYRKDLPPNIHATYWNAGYSCWYDDELTYDNGWFGKSSRARDTITFHEITHGQRTTDDDKFRDPYSNAYLLHELMHGDLNTWQYFRKPKYDADKKCCGATSRPNR